MTAPLRRRTRILAACAAAAAGALLLTGCQGSPGAAATVGDTTISEQQLADDVDQLTSDPNSGAAQDSSAVTSLLGRLITVALVDQLAAQHGVAATDGEIAAQLGAYEQQAGSKDAVYQVFAQQGVPASQVPSMLRLSVLATKLGPVLKPEGTSDEQTQAIVDAITALSDEVGVQVNPRWGAWDAKTLNLGPAPDDLSTVPSGA